MKKYNKISIEALAMSAVTTICTSNIQNGGEGGKGDWNNARQNVDGLKPTDSSVIDWD